MNWESSAKSLYKNIVENIPMPVKLIATPAISAAAEKRATANGKSDVTQTDLIEGIFEVVPQSFRARMVANLTSFSIDCEKHLTICNQPSGEDTNLAQLWSTLLSLSKSYDVPIDEAKTKAALETYSAFYKTSPLSIRMATSPQNNRELSVRYLQTIKAHTPDPLTMAVHNGFIAEDKSPLFLLFTESRQKLDVLGYGVDVRMYPLIYTH